VNDLAALGSRGVQSAWRAIDAMTKEIRNRGARAFIATVPPPRVGGSKAVPLSLIQTLNANIRDTARGEGAVLVDVFQALSADVSLYISFDGLHPTEAGYLKIAETFAAAIRQDLEVR
jgi:lysophospholipase L1-like esterase